MSLGDSKAYFRIGYIGFEQTWMDRLMNNTPHIQVFDTSKGIDLILNNDDHDHGHNSHDGHIHAVEPHVWNSTGNALIIAGNTYKALSQLDKTNEVYYRNRYDSLCQRIQHTDRLIRRQLSAPEAAKALSLIHIFHPAAKIGTHFTIDHGTGVVIGATSIIGNNVKLYQGVTLGAKSFPLDADGKPIKGIPRHPILEDNVIVYSNATILGRITIGRDATVGGNIWVTENVPAGARIVQTKAKK